jgi:hypothetical protein
MGWLCHVCQTQRTVLHSESTRVFALKLAKFCIELQPRKPKDGKFNSFASLGLDFGLDVASWTTVA